MDVILDTNIYVSLLRSKGANFLSTNVFLELVAYLRRTGHKLIIPDVVLQEFEAKYIELVVQTSKAAYDAWVSYSRNLSSTPPEPSFANAEKEWQMIRKDLLNPSKGVKVEIYDDYAKVPLRDVVARGVNRITPADAKGEELRDVVVWYMALEYSRKRQTAFITDDKDYVVEDGILEVDMLEYEADIKFYPSLNHFVAANSLTAHALADAELSQWVTNDETTKEIEEYVVGARFRETGTITSAKISAPTFLRGFKYEVDTDASYVEFSVSVNADLGIQPPTFITLANALNQFPPSGSQFGSVSGFYGEPTRWEPTRWRLANPLPSGETIFNVALKQPWETSVERAAAAPTMITETVTFATDFTMRIVNGKRESLELEQVAINPNVKFQSASAKQQQAEKK